MSEKKNKANIGDSVYEGHWQLVLVLEYPEVATSLNLYLSTTSYSSASLSHKIGP